MDIDGELNVPVGKGPAPGVREMRIGSRDIISRVKAMGLYFVGRCVYSFP